MQREFELIKTNSSNVQNYLLPITDLTKIFPDIQDELCSRHSTLLGKLKVTFNKLYDSNNLI
jgi:hypothetical protein